MKHWTLSQLKSYITAHGGHIPETHPRLKPRHYRLLVMAAAERIGGS